MNRGASIEIRQEPSGYWSASVIVRVPGLPDWRETAANFHDADEALDWTRSRIRLAVASASVA